MSVTATASPSRNVKDLLVDPETLKRWVEAGTAIIVDVREPEEHAREHIAGSRLVPLSRLSAADLPASGGTTIVLHCKGGTRSAEAAVRLAAAGRADVAQLKGGIEAWKGAGLPVVFNARVPISIMRQVQIVAGAAVFTTTILGAFVSPLFLLLTGFFGAGLIFAGASGLCGMAAVLRAMPWNRALRAPAAGACSGTGGASGGGCGGGACG